MATEFVKKRGPAVMATAMMALIAAEKDRLDDKKRLEFKLRISKMLEQLAEQSLVREAEMHDKTELATIEGAIGALRCAF
eukprot:529601-Prorocentrum_minimum.AAC.3